MLIRRISIQGDGVYNDMVRPLRGAGLWLPDSGFDRVRGEIRVHGNTFRDKGS